jgi:cytochrome c-type biogenesis protein CcmH
MIAFLAAAIIATLGAAAVIVVPLFRDKSSPAPVAAVFTAFAIPAVALLLYATINSYPWGMGGTGITPATTAGADTAEISALKQRLAQAPGEQTDWVSLGDAYIGEERFAEAREAYREAIRLGGANDGLRLAFAEASILADREALAEEAGRIIDEVLSRQPENPKALWYGGMAALGRGDTAVAQARWGKLLQLSPPPQVRQIIEQQLAAIEKPANAPAQGQAASATRIPVRITVKPELAERIRPGAAVFLIARTPGASGPPLAVVRRDAATLPLEVEISDADSMVPGRSMTGLAQINLTARVANDGEALAASGDVFGETVWSAAGQGEVRLQILMDQIVP